MENVKMVKEVLRGICQFCLDLFGPERRAKREIAQESLDKGRKETSDMQIDKMWKELDKSDAKAPKAKMKEFFGVEALVLDEKDTTE